METGYQVIARRWRPTQFDDLLGQDHIVRTLKNAIENDRLAHAYLFVGPRGTGKTTTARLFAKALNWENGPSIQTDNSTDLSQAIMQGRCLDVIEIDAASNRGVDQARELREETQYAPAQCRYKIFIIDEAHMLTREAFNALLKTLEEPPAHVKFVLATTEAQAMPTTIVSRCQRFEFRPLSEDTIIQQLTKITKAEGIDAEPEALAAVAQMADGGMRDAQSILDQLIGFCGGKVTRQDVLDVFGLAAPEQIEALAKALAEGDYGVMLAIAQDLAKGNRDLFRVLVDLQTRLRTGLHDAIAQGGKTDLFGATLTTEALFRAIDALHQGEGTVKTGLSERANFELTLLRAIEQSRLRAIDALLRGLQNLEETPEPGGSKKKSA